MNIISVIITYYVSFVNNKDGYFCDFFNNFE